MLRKRHGFYEETYYLRRGQGTNIKRRSIHPIQKFIRYKKEEKAKLRIEKLFYNGTAFANHHATAFLQIVRTMCSVPDLSTFGYIDNVVKVAP